MCYTAQTTVDAKHKLLIDYKVTNQNDKKAMGMMLRRSKSILRTNQFTALYDKGYHTGSEFYIADQLNIKTLVAIPNIGRSSQAPNPISGIEQVYMASKTELAVILSYFKPRKQLLLYTLPISIFQAIFNE